MESVGWRGLIEVCKGTSIILSTIRISLKVNKENYLNLVVINLREAREYRGK